MKEVTEVWNEVKELFALSGNLENILQFDGEIYGAEKDYALFYISILLFAIYTMYVFYRCIVS